MFTLKALSETICIDIKRSQLSELCVKASKIKTPKSSYHDGWVEYYLTMKTDDEGLNRTGTWPAYIVKDDGRLKFVWG